VVDLHVDARAVIRATPSEVIALAFASLLAG
jgi:hypothetical protein